MNTEHKENWNKLLYKLDSSTRIKVKVADLYLKNIHQNVIVYFQFANFLEHFYDWWPRERNLTQFLLQRL